MRHGCKSLAQFDIIPQPPNERAQNNPWPEWPVIYKLDYGQEEAAAQFGEDPREYLVSTTKFVGDNTGQVRELHTMKVEWVQGDDGRPFKEIPGTEQVWSADLVLLALGWLGPEGAILDELQVHRDERSNVKAELGKYKTNIDGVFAAGDVRRGASLVVSAFQEGREVARECDRYLMGSTNLP